MFPETLKSMDRWIWWRYEQKEGQKPTKIPRLVGDCGCAKTDDPTTWSSYSTCLLKGAPPETGGIGYVIAAKDSVIFIDLDHVRFVDNQGVETFTPGALMTLEAFKGCSYIEVSPSGEGMHILCEGVLPAHQKNKRYPDGSGLEVYGGAADSGRYTTMTGNQWGENHYGEADGSIPATLLLEAEGMLKPEVVAQEVDEAVVGATTTASKIAQARAYLAKFPGAVEGQGGDDHTFRAACKVLRGFALTEVEAFKALWEWNQTCSPPWTEKELLTKLRNADNHGSEAWGGRLRAPDTLDSIRKEFGVDVSKIPAVKDVLDAPKGSQFLTGDQILAEKITNPLWLVKGLLPEGGVCVIGGEPKSTKTWLAMELGMALATGTKALDEYEVPTKKNVAVFLAEDGKRSVQARLTALAGSREMEPSLASKSMHICCRGHLNILDKEEVKQLVLDCKQIPDLGLLILDPLRDLHLMEENDSTAMAKVTKALRILRDVLGCSVLFVHHAHKSTKDTSNRREGQQMRGSSVIHGAIDAGIYLSGTETDMRTFWKNKVAVEIKEGAGAGRFGLTLWLNNDSEGRAYDGNWDVEKIESTYNQGANEVRAAILMALTSVPQGAAKIRIKTGKMMNVVCHELKEMLTLGLIGYVDHGKTSPKSGYVVLNPTDGVHPAAGVVDEQNPEMNF